MDDMSNNDTVEYGVAISGVQNHGAGPASIWTHWSQAGGKIVDWSSPAKGNNFGQRYRNDIRLASKLGCRIFRFSIDWSRVEPSQGCIDENYLVFCGQVISEIRKHGMKPVVTLFHFDYPQWFEDIGGFFKVSNHAQFLNFVATVVRRFKGLIFAWVTVNEPITLAFNQYVYSGFPPGIKYPFIKGLYKAILLADRFAALHIKTYNLIKQLDRATPTGFSSNLCRILPYRQHNIFDNLLAKLFSWLWNFRFIDKTVSHTDYIGVQYYTRAKLLTRIGGNIGGFLQEYGLTRPTGEVETSDTGWDIVPEGLAFFLHELWKRYQKPLFITESGIAEAGTQEKNGELNDRKRQKYIKSTVDIVDTAVKNGINIIGVLWWTLVDNWEWSLGYGPKFGFCSVNPDGKRRLRKSAAMVAYYSQPYQKRYFPKDYTTRMAE